LGLAGHSPYRQVIPIARPTKQQVAQLKLDAVLAEQAWLRAQESCRTFIERWVKIEDRDAPGLVVPFSLWPAQRDALQAFLDHRLVIVLKARQLGLSWLALAYAVWRMVFTPGYAVKALSKKEDPDAKELVRRVVFILGHLPSWMVRPRKGCDPRFAGPTWEATTLSVTIYHRGGEPSTFQSLSAAPDSGRSMTGNLLIIDEWAFQEWAGEIWASTFPTVNRPTGGQVIGLSTMKRGTLFDELSQAAEAGQNDFHEVFLSRWADPRRDQAWFEATKRNLPNTWRSEYPETPEEARSVGVGAFFEEWQEAIHVKDEHWEPPNDPSWPIIGVYDPGYNQACFKWYTISPGVDGFPRGWARCFREYYPKNTIDPDQAREILRLSCYGDGKKQRIWLPRVREWLDLPGTPFKFARVLADTSAWSPSRGTGRSTAEVFASFGLVMAQADKNLENGWRRLHEWLKPIPVPGYEETGVLSSMLTFTRDCHATRRTYPACEASESNPGDISKKTPHDPQDCDRYFVMSRPAPSEIKPDPLDALRKQFPEYSPSFQFAARWIGQDDESKQITADELGM
jgi:hypothetical protein